MTTTQLSNGNFVTLQTQIVDGGPSPGAPTAVFTFAIYATITDPSGQQIGRTRTLTEVQAGSIDYTVAALPDGGFVLGLEESIFGGSSGFGTVNFAIRTFDKIAVSTGPAQKVYAFQYGEGIPEAPTFNGFEILADGDTVVNWTDATGPQSRTFDYNPIPGDPNFLPDILGDRGFPGATYLENSGSLNVFGFPAIDADGDAITWAIVGGADADLFTISTVLEDGLYNGPFSFKAAPDFEAPGSAAGTNTYDLILAANDGKGSTTVRLNVTVENDVRDDGPITIRGTAGDDRILPQSGFPQSTANADRILAGFGNDVVDASLGDDFIFGGAGNDILRGGDGNDELHGESGSDTLKGGAGQDMFVFDTAPVLGEIDKIMDFNSIDDRIMLSLEAFSALAGIAGGTLSAGAFAVGRVATTVDHHLIYNPVNGRLYYDADGIGGEAQVHFATLIGRPSLAADDFILG